MKNCSSSTCLNSFISSHKMKRTFYSLGAKKNIIIFIDNIEKYEKESCPQDPHIESLLKLLRESKHSVIYFKNVSSIQAWEDELKKYEFPCDRQVTILYFGQGLCEIIDNNQIHHDYLVNLTFSSQTELFTESCFMNIFSRLLKSGSPMCALVEIRENPLKYINAKIKYELPGRKQKYHLICDYIVLIYRFCDERVSHSLLAKHLLAEFTRSNAKATTSPDEREIQKLNLELIHGLEQQRNAGYFSNLSKDRLLASVMLPCLNPNWQEPQIEKNEYRTQKCLCIDI